MKRPIIMAAAAIAVAAGAFLPAKAVDVKTKEIDGVEWKYYVNNAAKKTITLGTNQERSPAIPTETALDASQIPWTMEIDGATYTVTEVGTGAFYECKNLTGTLSIPDTVTTLGTKAFYGCTGLTAVDSWGGVTSWGKHAFYESKNIKGQFPDLSKATSLGEYNFGNVPLTGELKLGTALKTIPRLAFGYCRFGGAAVVPPNVTQIAQGSDHGTFLENPNLEAIWVKGPATASSQTYTKVYVNYFAQNCTALKLVLMGQNTECVQANKPPLDGVTGAVWLAPANGKWDILTDATIGGKDNRLWKYGPDEDFDLDIDDAAMTATFTPKTEDALANALKWAPSFKKHFGLDTVVSVTTAISASAATMEIMEEALEGVTLDAPSWYLTFQVKTQSQLDRVLAAVSGPIVADITGATEKITVPEGRQVAVLVSGGATFGYRASGLVIAIR